MYVYSRICRDNGFGDWKNRLLRNPICARQVCRPAPSYAGKDRRTFQSFVLVPIYSWRVFGSSIDAEIEPT
jgi:hypothetical protein